MALTQFAQLVVDDAQLPESFVVASGRPADNGKDEEFKWDDAFDRHVNDWQGDAPVNYYSMSSIVTVDKDAVIGRIEPMVPATNGIDVHGNILAPVSSPQQIRIGNSIRRADDDPSQLISNVAGKVVQLGHQIMVDEVFYVGGDVSFETGNINSPAEVHITGAVPDRFEVRCTKSITVGGAVEAAHLDAKEDVVVGGGILGRHVGSVRSGQDIIAKFCSEADLFASRDVKIAKQVMNSKIRAEGRLIAEHSAVIGGYTFAKQGADVFVLGTESGTPTVVFSGTRPDVLAQCAAIDANLEPQREAIKKIKDRVQPLLKNLKRLTPAQREQATELMFKAEEAAAQVAEQEQRRDEMLETTEGATPKVRVSKAIYPRVTIYLGSRAFTFDKEIKGPVSIEMRQLNNVTEMVAVNQLTGSLQILKCQQIPVEQLMKEFQPLLEETPE